MKATIVSFMPWEFQAQIPGVIPGDYRMPKSDGKTPQVLVVNDAVSMIYMGADRGTFPSPIPVDQLAKSLVDDSKNSYLEIDTDSGPALFWVEGSVTAKEVLDKHSDKVTEAKTRQNRWFMKLIKVGDDTWTRFHQHKMISGIQREAAKQLGLAKEWAVDPEPVILVKCPACMTMIENNALVCKNCKAIIDKKKAAESGITFAA